MRPSHIETILDREFLSCTAGQHTPVMLWGPPGVGKSQIIAGIAERHGAPLIDLRLSQMEPTDLRGIPFRKGDNVEWSVPAMLPDAERHGPAGILFLDEINAAPPTVSAAAYQLILDRRLGEYAIPEGWAIFAAGNRQGDRGVTYAMPAPLANRFTHYDMEANLDDWIARVKNELPELPGQMRERFINDLGLSAYDARTLTASLELADYFESTVAIAGIANAKPCANWVMVDLAARLNKEGRDLGDSPVSAAQLAGLVQRIADGTISNNIAKKVFEALWNKEGSTADEIIDSG